LQIVPEYVLIQCAKIFEEESTNNSFKIILLEGDKFKEAGLTPIYIQMMEDNIPNIIITSQERLENKLH
jgi:hypothetical protein